MGNKTRSARAKNIYSGLSEGHVAKKEERDPAMTDRGPQRKPHSQTSSYEQHCGDSGEEKLPTGASFCFLLLQEESPPGCRQTDCRFQLLALRFTSPNLRHKICQPDRQNQTLRF